MDKIMTNLEDLDLSTYCKKICGLDAGEVAKASDVPRRTLYDWWKNRRRAVELIVKGISTEQIEAKYAQDMLKYERMSRIVKMPAQSGVVTTIDIHSKEGYMDKQYFERLELEDNCIWAVFETENGMRKAPLKISGLSFPASNYPEEVVIQQETGGWWYSRTKYNAADAKSYADEITMMMNKLEQRKRVF